MFNKLKAVSALVIASYVSPVMALGVGTIDMHSSMSQPLDASIDIYGIEGMASSQLVAKMASLQDFERAGVLMDYHLESIKFAVELDGKGGGLIRLTSDDLMVEPYLNFVLDLRWPDGRILREYTALMDFLPVTPAPDVSPVVQQSNVSSAPAVSTEMPVAPAGMVRVENGDSLWRIALQVRPNRDYSPQQTMRALVKKNPQAFLKSNINGLQAGVLLQIPSAEEVSRASKEQASAWVASQNTQWTNPQFDSEDSVVTDVAAEPVVTPEVTNEAYVRLANADVTESIASSESKIEDKSLSNASEFEDEPLSDLPVNDELSQRLAMTLEDLDKSQRQNDEMAQRLAALEEQVKTMQRLMVLKDQELAKMQQSSSPQQWWQSPLVLGGGFVALLSLLGGLVWTRKRQQDVKHEPAQTVSVVEAPAAEGLNEQPAVVVDATPQSARKAFAAEVMQEIVTPVDKSLEDSSQTDQANDNVSDLDDFAQKENTIDEALVEIDIYVAYGRASAALDLVKDLANNHPDNDVVRLKVMEVAAIAGDLSNLENVRADLNASTDPETQTAWAALQSQHAVLLADASSISDADQPEVTDDDATVSEHLDWDIGLDEQQIEDSSSEDNIEQLAKSDDDVELNDDLLNNFDAIEDTIEESPVVGLDEAADLDLDLDTMELNDDDFSEENLLSVAPEALAEDLPDLDFDDLNHDESIEDASLSNNSDELDLDAMEKSDLDADEAMDFGDLDEMDLSQFAEETDLSDLDDDSLDLADLEKDIMLDSDDGALDDIISESLPDDEGLDIDDLLSDFDEIDTKLELVKAYIDMGDADGAREILEDILLDGNDEQKSTALALKEQLT